MLLLARGGTSRRPRSKSRSKPSGERSCAMSRSHRLYIAAHALDFERVEALLAAGASVNWQHPITGLSVLWECVDRACGGDKGDHADTMRMIRCLCTARADTNSVDGTRTPPVVMAAANGEKDIVELLCQHGANVNLGGIVCGLRGWRAHLYFATLFTCFPPAKRWRRHALNWTALHEVAHNGYTDIVDLLLGAGADVNGRDLDGETPLHAACSQGHAAMVEALLQHGASLDAKNVDGEMAHHSVLSGEYTEGHEKCLHLLVHAGADLDACDARGRDVVALARRENRRAAVDFLSRYPGERALADEVYADPLSMDLAAVRRGLHVAWKQELAAPHAIERCMERWRRSREAQADPAAALRLLLKAPPLGVEVDHLVQQIEKLEQTPSKVVNGGEIPPRDSDLPPHDSEMPPRDSDMPPRDSDMRPSDGPESAALRQSAAAYLEYAQRLQTAAAEGSACLFYFVDAEKLRETPIERSATDPLQRLGIASTPRLE